MPPSASELLQMDGRGVIVTTPDGAVVSLGVVRSVAPSQGDPVIRLELHFETETMRCMLRIPGNRVEALVKSWDGGACRYVLPAGDGFWKRDALERTEPPAPSPVIESFPLPLARAVPGKSQRAQTPIAIG